MNFNICSKSADGLFAVQPHDVNNARITGRLRVSQQPQASFGDIASDFDRLFDDVENLTRLEGLALDHILRDYNASSVLDCACGTGIQSIGLAKLGYQVSASDISLRIIQELKTKAEADGLAITAKRAGFRDLKGWQSARFDAVVCSGNSLTLVPKIEDIPRALTSMLRVVRASGGVVVVGMHNYLRLKQEGKNLLVRRISTDDGDGEIVLDLRSFGADRVQITYMFINLVDTKWRLRTYTKSYLCLSANELRDTMLKVGFDSVQLLDISGQREFRDDEWVLAVGTT